MGKQKTPKAPPIPRTHFARINYLYQASHLLLPTPAQNISTHYLSTAKSVARKAVLRLDPSVKRTICKKCDALLVPGKTSKVRVENESRGGRKVRADVLVVECVRCGCAKRFPVGRNSEYVLWADRDETLGIEKKGEDEKKSIEKGKGKEKAKGAGPEKGPSKEAETVDRDVVMVINE